LLALLRERVYDPIGLAPEGWSIGYGRAYELDGFKLYANWGGGAFAPRAVARLGQLMLQKGRWGRRQLLDRAWVERAVAWAGTPKPDRAADPAAPASGLCWYTNFDGVWPDVPKDAFAGAGAGHQFLLVVPSLDLVVVRNGAALSTPFWSVLLDRVMRPVMAAIGDKPVAAPYPASDLRLEFAPETEIACQAVDSDNWPITWADDGHLYASYGDGWGFDPRTERKLSLGFARIEGPPEAFRGVNIRSATGEREGDGPRGPKASGMVMVDGVLYMWVRNTGNAQLAWSDDRGRTWNWGFRFESGFGSPAFLNLGRNYEGARDRYVYTYSQDGPSAYESDDGLALARVPKDRIRDRGAWEFRREDGWTKDIAARGRVFSFPGHCQRVDAVYNPGLKRYLLALGYGHTGAWGIYEAPEPWGPWRTVFHTNAWGLGGTHGYRLPSKWISADGKTMHLVFSGVKLADANYDAFCVRKFVLRVTPGSPRGSDPE
jgi:hypothetical protein